MRHPALRDATGHQPFTGETPIQVAFQHVNNDVPAPSELVRLDPDRDRRPRPGARRARPGRAPSTPPPRSRCCAAPVPRSTTRPSPATPTSHRPSCCRPPPTPPRRTWTPSRRCSTSTRTISPRRTPRRRPTPTRTRPRCSRPVTRAAPPWPCRSASACAPQDSAAARTRPRPAGGTVRAGSSCSRCSRRWSAVLPGGTCTMGPGAYTTVPRSRAGRQPEGARPPKPGSGRTHRRLRRGGARATVVPSGPGQGDRSARAHRRVHRLEGPRTTSHVRRARRTCRPTRGGPHRRAEARLRRRLTATRRGPSRRSSLRRCPVALRRPARRTRGTRSRSTISKGPKPVTVTSRGRDDQGRRQGRSSSRRRVEGYADQRVQQTVDDGC